MKKLLFTISLLLPMVASAYDVVVDEIAFNLIPKGNVAEVAPSGWYHGDVNIPSSFEHDGVIYQVTGIGKEAFRNCKELSHVTLPNTIITIGYEAFAYCSTIESINIPSSVKTIEGGAFENSYPKKIYIENLSDWCNISFGYYTSNPIQIWGQLIVNGEELTDLVIPEDITEIKDYAFYWFNALKSITFHDHVKSIGNYAFNCCEGLNTLVLPNSITTIGYNAFANCHNLVNVHLPENLDKVPNFMFAYCEKLESVNIPNSVVRIGESAFRECSGLNNISFGNNIQSIYSMAFFGCSSLTELTLPHELTTISDYAFQKCSELKKVTFGKNLKSIYNYAFANCPKLECVYNYAETVPTISDVSFMDSYIEYAKLYVPATLLSEYKSTDIWKNFGYIYYITDESEKCSKPTILYSNGKIVFNCETEGAECVATISDPDIKTHYGNEIPLTATYTVSVYATATGYENSDVATATICWIDADPRTDGIENGIAQVRANAVLIQSHDGTINIEGVADGTDIVVYSSAGMMVGAAKASCSSTSVPTGLRNGEIAIVKIGDKSVKVIMK